jgi:hypothetical protein
MRPILTTERFGYIFRQARWLICGGFFFLAGAAAPGN